MKKRLIILLLIILIMLTTIFFYSKYVTSKSLKVNEYSIIDKKIPENFNGLKIVQFSDIKYGKVITSKELNKVINEINKLNPDIVIFTGDLYTKDVKINKKDLDTIKNLINKIDSKYEKYAIMGDNDKKNKDNFYQVFQDNFKILDNENTLFYLNDTTPIEFYGINDIKNEDLSENNYYKILLTHKPDNITKFKNKYNIVLSGHSMGGQIKVPFYGPLIKLKGSKTYISGKYEVNDSILFVNDGLGSENLTIRINNKPSINLYRIYNK